MLAINQRLTVHVYLHQDTLKFMFEYTYIFLNKIINKQEQTVLFIIYSTKNKWLYTGWEIFVLFPTILTIINIKIDIQPYNIYIWFW